MIPDERFMDISTDDLVTEIMVRSDAAVFLNLGPGQVGDATIKWRYKGDEDYCVGLTKTLALKIASHKVGT